MMEGTSGRHAPRPFTGARARRPRLLPHRSPNPTGAPRANTSASCPPREGAWALGGEVEATGVSEARSPRAPRVEQARAREQPVKTRRSEVRVRRWPAEAVVGVVNHPFPWSYVAEPRLRVVNTRRKPRSLPGTHEARVHAVVRSGGRRRSNASRVFLATGPQGHGAHGGR